MSSPLKLPKVKSANCKECPLQEYPFVPSYLPEDAEVFVVGEGPGVQEVRQGKPFVGQSGILLGAAFKQEGVDYEKVARSNVVCCRPPNNRAPTRKEAKCCWPRLAREVVEAEPKVIIPVGKEAADYVLPNTEGMKVSERRGHWFKAYGTPTLPTWHPAYVLRRPGAAKDFFNDIHRALNGSPEHFLHNPPEVIHVTEPWQLKEMIDEIPVDAFVAFDLETDQVMWYDRPEAPADEILMMGVTWERNRCYIVAPEAMDVDLLKELFDYSNLKFVAHNGKFDVIFLRANGVNNARCDWDTMLAHYVLWEEPGTHGLKNLALEYFGLPDYEKELVQKYLKSRNDRYSKVPYNELAQYCAWDCCVTLELRNVLGEELVAQDLYDRPFMQLIMPMQRALTEVEWNGVPIDRDYVEKWQQRIFDYCDQLEADMQTMADDPVFNPRSPMQVSHYMYNVRKLPRPRARGVKPTSTAKKAIAHIKEGDDEFVDLLRTYRRAHKMNRSYMKNLLLYCSTSGRVHPSALLHGTEVGRLSYRNPAIQTIPRPYEDLYGAMVRSSFVAPPGWRFVLADYSQAELRVVAILSEEPFLLNVYKDGRDLHSEVAIGMYGEDFNKAQRVLCKMFNFSYIYGGSEYSFAEDSGLPLGTARQFVRDYNKLMPKLAEYKKEQFDFARTMGYVVSPFGRRRRFLLITQQNLDDVRKAAVHMPVASTASDLTQLSLVKAVDEGIHVVLTVHDSIGALAREEQAEETAAHLKWIMETTASKYFPQIPWGVDAEVRDRWAPTPEEIHGEQVHATFG
jgi:uracil-DNA glycosylase family 4